MNVSSGEIEDAPSWQAAKRLLGTRFFGPEEWDRFFAHTGPAPYGETIPPFPWETALLESACPFVPGKAIRQTHVAFLGRATLGGTPLTLWRWKKRCPSLFNARARPWYWDEAFARQATCEARWYLMPLAGLSRRTVQTVAEHQALLPPAYAVPSVIEEATKLLLFHARNRRFPPSPYAWSWCRDTVSREEGVRQVALSVAGMQRLKIGAFPTRKPRENLGLAVARLLPALLV